MSKFLFLSFLLLAQAKSFCQQQSKIVSSTPSIQYLERKAGGATTAIRNVSITVEYWSNANSGNSDQTLVFNISAVTPAGSYTLTKESSNPVITAAEFSTARKTKSFDISIRINDVATYIDASFNINLTMGSTAESGGGVIQITKDDKSTDAKTKYDGVQPYWVETGTNIDFIDGPKLNNLTAGIFYQKLDNDWGTKCKTNRWGLFAGAYEAKIISNITTMPFSNYNFINNNSFMSGRNDTIKVYNYAGKPQLTQTIRNWSFFLSPSYRLTRGKYNDSNFQISVAFWGELRYQEVQLTSDYSSLVLFDSSYDNIKNVSQYKSTSDTIFTTGIYSHYYGFGAPLYYEDKSVILFINPVIGISNQPSNADFDSLSQGITENRKWRPFYFVQFRLSDNLFGITVTGEIRGLIIKNSPPQYTIALTKKFNLGKLLTYNK